jgi:hypothetical protein
MSLSRQFVVGRSVHESPTCDTSGLHAKLLLDTIFPTFSEQGVQILFGAVFIWYLEREKMSAGS